MVHCYKCVHVANCTSRKTARTTRSGYKRRKRRSRRRGGADAAAKRQAQPVAEDEEHESAQTGVNWWC